MTQIAPTLLLRICEALEIKPRNLAIRLKLDYHLHVRPLIGAGVDRPEIDKDETWLTIAAYVDERLGGLMAIRHEMTISLERERAQRMLHTVSHLQRTKRSSPRL